MLQLYNTLTRRIEPITPVTPPVVTVYTCGPTVYDYPHIGNWFTFIRYDLLVRTLQAAGYKPLWVMNLTDVGHLVSDADDGEDKLEKGARREGKTAWDVATYYSRYFIDGLQRLNITTPNYLPRATEHIGEQIALVAQLEAKGFTYKTSDGVYYDTSKFPRYSDFAQLDTDEQQAGVRVEYNPEKRNPSDFALWKFSPTDRQRDMEWDSPWGRGFPGWHLECSAMSMKYLGKTLDIHAGGIDHVPVHHTNEIAQSEPVTGQPYARSWMHTNHILIDGEKISKSLGNGYTLEDIEQRGVELDAFRMLVLESHYRSQSKFSWESLEAAASRLQNLRSTACLVYQPVTRTDDHVTQATFTSNYAQLVALLSQDLATPQMLAELQAFLDIVAIKRFDIVAAAAFHHYLLQVESLLGITLMPPSDITDAQKLLICDREAARQAKDWIAADNIRAKLIHDHIAVRDTALGTVWFYLPHPGVA